MNKTLLLTLIAVMLLLAGCGGETPPAATTPSPADMTAGTAGVADGTPEVENVPARPVIRLSADGTTYNALPGAYCWLQAVNDIRCEPDPLNPQPEPAVPVSAGDTVNFTVDSEAGPPASFYATLLDDEDADGDPMIVEFGQTDSAEYQVDLEPGTHRVSVVAEFPDVSGDNSFVTGIFSLNVGAGVASNLTPRPSVTPVATEETTEKPGDETAEPTEAMAEPTEEVVPEETEAVGTEPTDLPTQPPTSTPRPTEAATEMPTVPPSPTVSAALQPTATTASQVVTPPAAGETGWPPEVIVVNGGREFTPFGLRICEGAEQTNCTDQPAPASSESVVIGSGDTIRIDADQGGPLSMRVILASTDLAREFQRTDFPGSEISLHTVSGDPGNYVLIVETVWSEGTVTYYFQMQIVG